MEENKKRRRRRHPADFKARAAAACQVPGASLVGVASEWQLNANLLRRWVKEAIIKTALISGDGVKPEKAPTFGPSVRCLNVRSLGSRLDEPGEGRICRSHGYKE